MANELRVRQNFLGGLIEDNPLTAAATTMTSAALAAAVAIGTTQHLPIILDPDGIYGEPEIAWVTAHTGAATSATLLRGQEGTTARQHQIDVNWVHGPSVQDFVVPRIGISVYITAVQSIPNAVATAVAYTSERYDTHGFHDNATNNSRLTIPAGMGGLYLATVGGEFATNATGQRAVHFRLNGSAGYEAINTVLGSTITQRFSLSHVLPMVDGDYLEMLAYQDSGAALNFFPYFANTASLGAIYYTLTRLAV